MHIQVALWKRFVHTKIKTKLEENDRLYMEETHLAMLGAGRTVILQRLIIST